jgi:hypothetical protein
MTLLELTLATSLMTTMVVGVAVVLRTGHVAWEACQGDASQIMAAGATVRHIVRRVRQAQEVTSISQPANKSGKLSLLMPSGETIVWERTNSTDEVLFGIGTADSLLAQQVTAMYFTGYAADGITPTAVPADIYSVKCRLSVELPRATGGTRNVSCWAWLRAR